jgi:hypothetical protein
MPRSVERSEKMSGQINTKERARIATVMRFYIATGQDLEAALVFDRKVCDVLEIDPEAEPPTFLTDPRVLD